MRLSVVKKSKPEKALTSRKHWYCAVVELTILHKTTSNRTAQIFYLKSSTSGACKQKIECFIRWTIFLWVRMQWTGMIKTVTPVERNGCLLPSGVPSPPPRFLIVRQPFYRTEFGTLFCLLLYITFFFFTHFTNVSSFHNHCFFSSSFSSSPGSHTVPWLCQWSCATSWTLLRSVCVASPAWTATFITWPLWGCTKSLPLSLLWTRRELLECQWRHSCVLLSVTNSGNYSQLYIVLYTCNMAKHFMSRLIFFQEPDMNENKFLRVKYLAIPLWQSVVSGLFHASSLK